MVGISSDTNIGTPTGSIIKLTISSDTNVRTPTSSINELTISSDTIVETQFLLSLKSDYFFLIVFKGFWFLHIKTIM
jgi:hypothetical protein